MQEFHEYFPSLCRQLLMLMLPSSARNDADQVDSVMARLGMVYAILMQARFHELSLVQRLFGTILADGMCDVKVCSKLYIVGKLYCM